MCPLEGSSMEEQAERPTQEQLEKSAKSYLDDYNETITKGINFGEMEAFLPRFFAGGIRDIWLWSRGEDQETMNEIRPGWISEDAQKVLAILLSDIGFKDSYKKFKNKVEKGL